MKLNEQRVLKLAGLIPESSDIKTSEAIEDLSVNLPTQLEKFLDKLVNTIKGYNLPRKKETLVIAKIVDAMGMDKTDVMRAIQKIKQAGVVSEAIDVNDIKPGFVFFELEDGYTDSGRGTVSHHWEVTKDMGNDKFECVLTHTTESLGRPGYKKTFTKSEIARTLKSY